MNIIVDNQLVVGRLPPLTLVYEWEALQEDDLAAGILTMFTMTLLTTIAMIVYIATSSSRAKRAKISVSSVSGSAGAARSTPSAGFISTTVSKSR